MGTVLLRAFELKHTTLKKPPYLVQINIQ